MIPTTRRVEDTIYRSTLAREGVTLRARKDAPPEPIQDLIQKVGRRRSSPGPTAREIIDDEELEALEGYFGRGLKRDVQQYFQRKIFPPQDSQGPLDLSVRQHILSHAIPRNNELLGNMPGMPGICQPVPDLLYGYRLGSFTLPQREYLEQKGYELQATKFQQYLPFFLVEFKGEGGIARVATNQCMGGSACCANITERLNQQVQACSSVPATGEPRVDGAIFSVGVHNDFARLFVSWQREDGINYETARMDDFVFHKPADYIKLRTSILNIIDWGLGERLQQVNAALDLLVAESHQEAAAARKAREPPQPLVGPGLAVGISSGGKRMRY
ncbi:hypothetical protein SBRCBS47491_000593 [Sporothrix bragantina]|uniref:DUF7924 domain-containing protein n=1 Tax=Sporothrix bragantina TaxID=671064 RepID=A0ABP0ARM0_9PEZI